MSKNGLSIGQKNGERFVFYVLELVMTVPLVLSKNIKSPFGPIFGVYQKAKRKSMIFGKSGEK